MNSPNSPLNTIMLERTAVTYLIIFIVNQLFISNNDVIELGWLEREFFSTDRTKFDGIIFKFGDKSIAPGLVEFSGGINDKTSSQKNMHNYIQEHRKQHGCSHHTLRDDLEYIAFQLIT